MEESSRIAELINDVFSAPELADVRRVWFAGDQRWDEALLQGAVNEAIEVIDRQSMVLRNEGADQPAILRLHDILSRLQFVRFVTMNFDALVERAFEARPLDLAIDPLALTIDPNVPPPALLETLEAMADYFRACSGAGLVVSDSSRLGQMRLHGRLD